ncbi:Hsp20/alpha crystallin family protein [Virgibacillus sp. C22-A2]|uniref:Hsp20/alpha crystallin family protein n=1 Tax=Virgibacillus tibetensis TaxID=3042313 RepID=A0ABU6KGY7_9BACI|nr:Hsp20/alpha crystallin family protein [Virgibacillus sp. C22-A2]
MSSNKDKLPKQSDETPFNDIMKNLDSFFNESVKNFNSLFNQSTFDVDVYETKSNVIIEAKLPGYKRDQIKLEIIGNQIKIYVENTKLEEFRNDQRKYRSNGRSFQSMERSIPLSFTISEKDTRASYKNGILKITTPKMHADRRFIDIED